MDPLTVATSAADAAGLGVQLAQDLYQLASEHPSVECQIGRIAQAFVDLNLALADIASVLSLAPETAVLTRPYLDALAALVRRINGVQTTFRSKLNGVGASGKKRNKKTANRLAQLKTLFPGSGAAERFTEMEWMRNTLSLLAAVVRIATTQVRLEAPRSAIPAAKTALSMIFSTHNEIARLWPEAFTSPCSPAFGLLQRR